MKPEFVIFDNEVYTVYSKSTKMYQLRQYGVDFNYQTWVDIDLCTPITREVADCMVACDPPMLKYVGYRVGWTDAKGIF